MPQKADSCEWQKAEVRKLNWLDEIRKNRDVLTASKKME